MLSITCTLLLLASPLSAQILDGDLTRLGTWSSPKDSIHWGNAISGGGDLNGDGFDDILIGAGGLSSGMPGWATAMSGADHTVLHKWKGPVPDSRFGGSIAHAGDVNGDGFDDVIVGAYDAGVGLLQKSGSVFVYSGINGSLLYEFNGAMAEDKIGFSVAGPGDVNQDGFDDILVGSSRGWHQPGIAYLYSGADGNLMYQWDGTENGDFFGYSVSGAGDINADGILDIIIGAPYENGSAGAIYVFSGVDGSLIWTRQPTSSDIKNFGETVDSAGDVNRDGFDDLLVGAPQSTVNGRTTAGIAGAYSGVDGSTLHYIPHDGWGTHFGSSVAGIGDFNGNGYPDFLITAPEEQWGQGIGSGATYIYTGYDGSLVNVIEPDRYVGSLGQAISFGGDTNGDGAPEILTSCQSTFDGDGDVYLYTHAPFIQASTQTIDASAGTQVDLDMVFPRNNYFKEYRVVFSAAGNGPYFDGVQIPLTLDSLLLDSLAGNYPFAASSDLHGVLDFHGDATASFTTPGALPVAFVGTTLQLAVILNHPGRLPELSSLAIEFLVVQ